MRRIMRGDIVYIDLGQHSKSSVQSGMRPCVVLSNNKNNQYSSILNVCPFTSKLDKKYIPVHVLITPDNVKGYLRMKAVFLGEQIVTVDRRKVISKVGHIDSDSELMKSLETAIKKQLGMDEGGNGNV